MAITAGTHLGRYEIRSKIGEGGMGEVYLAQDPKLDRRVALKILPSDLAANQDRMRRFVQEAKAASALNHPNILTIYEIDDTNLGHFIASEFIDGETLRERMRRAQMKLIDVLDVAMQIASALAAAHAAGIAHRDIKPENVMLRHDGIVKVLDFGLAKLSEPPAGAGGPNVDTEAATRANVKTEPGRVMGTVAYMSPEQARGRALDGRSDIWSLGVVLYEMVAGRAPFEGETSSHVIVSLLEHEPALLARLAADAPAELQRIVRKCLTKERDERYQTARDLMIDLKNLRRELDLQSELERSAAPHSTEAPTKVINDAAATGKTGARQTSSVEYVVTEIKRHKKGAILIAALTAIAVAASILFVHSRGARALTEKDTILLTDFVNPTGDAVFDGTLKQALAVQLGQSPFLNIFSEDRVRGALRFMGRPAEERVTRDVGREICQRQGLKAMLAGSIASLGNHYVITLEIVNAQTGDAIAREQAEAESKEQVLPALGEAATKLREKLGESLASIQKFEGLNRFDEAKEVIGRALAQKVESVHMHRILYSIAFIQGDDAGMKQQIEWVNGKPEEYTAQNWQSETAAFSGQLRKAKEFSSRAAELAQRRDLKEPVTQIVAGDAGRDALFGDCKQIKEKTAKALAITESQPARFSAANALAVCGEFSQMQAINDELVKRYPKDTLLNRVFLPLIQARAEMYRGNAAQAIQLLETTRPYEGAALFQVPYLRGQAYLSQQKGVEAATEFQKILDHRGWQPATPLYPLAHLGLARAAALSGDTTKARKAYQDFFALWKDADADLSVLIEAKKEYEKLK